MTAAQWEMYQAADDGDIDRIIACGRGNPRLLVEGVDDYRGRTALYWASGAYGQVKGS